MEKWIVELDFGRTTSVYAENREKAEDISKKKYKTDFIRVIGEDKDLKLWSVELDFDSCGAVYAKTLEEAEDLAEERYGVDFVGIITDEDY